MSQQRLSALYRRVRRRPGRRSTSAPTGSLRVGTAPRHVRRRRIRQIVALAVGSLIIGEVALQVVDSSGPAGVTAAKTWVAAVGPLAVGSGRLGPTVEMIRADALHLGRTVLDNDLASLVLNTKETGAQFESLGVAAPSRTIGTLLSDVVTKRAEGARLLAAGIDLALGSGTALAATNELSNAGELMIAADLDYQRIVLLVPVKGGADTLPSSRWITNIGEWTVPSLSAWVSELQGATALRTHHSISLVAVSIEPPVLRFNGLPTTTTTTTSTTTTTTTSTTTTAVGASGQSGASSTSTSSTTSSTVPVTTTTVPPTTTTLQVPPPGATAILAPTPSISIVVVVSNSGNVTENKLRLTASLTPHPAATHGGHASQPSPGGTRSTAIVIGTLQPGGSRYVILPALRVVAGETYDLTVTASAVGTGGATDVVSDSFVVMITG